MDYMKEDRGLGFDISIFVKDVPKEMTFNYLLKVLK